MCLFGAIAVLTATITACAYSQDVSPAAPPPSTPSQLQRPLGAPGPVRQQLQDMNQKFLDFGHKFFGAHPPSFGSFLGGPSLFWSPPQCKVVCTEPVGPTPGGAPGGAGAGGGGLEGAGAGGAGGGGGGQATANSGASAAAEGGGADAGASAMAEASASASSGGEGAAA